MVEARKSRAAGGGLDMGDGRTVVQMFLRMGCKMLYVEAGVTQSEHERFMCASHSRSDDTQLSLQGCTENQFALNILPTN